jgi:Cof subfamily protein (haloacid dehalogenase superfamily)
MGRIIMNKLVFLDLDGTLWENENIPHSAVRAIERAQANGHKIFVNTGRTRNEAIDVLEPLHLDGYCFGAGSEIYYQGKRILYEPLKKKDIQTIYDLLNDLHFGISLEGSAKSFCNFINKGMYLHAFNTMPNTFALLRFLNSPGMDEFTEADYDQIMKIYLYNIEHVPYEQIIPKLPKTTELTEFADWKCEITNRKYNKATAIRTVRKLFDDSYETMAMGDSENDIPMLKEADLAVVMGNGSPRVKPLGDYVTSDIHQDGLYNAFQHFHLI